MKMATVTETEKMTESIREISNYDDRVVIERGFSSKR